MGRAVREVRVSEGITLDQLARQAREHGLRWSTARVIEFEKGALRLTLPMLLVVAQSLSELTGREIGLGHLIPPSSSPFVRVTDEWVVNRSRLAKILGFQPVRLGTLVDVGGDWTHQDLKETADAVAGAFARLSPTLAEERAAKRLGVRPRRVAAAAHILWRRHLDEEVAARAGSDASPQAKGHITRQLLAEIDATLQSNKGAVDGDG